MLGAPVVDSSLVAALALLPGRLAAHVGLSAAALGLALTLAVPLVALMRARPRSRGVVMALAALVQTVPALALLALFYPLLLAVRGATGTALPVLGFLPALLALTLYALLPLLRGAVTGLAAIDPDIREAADALGMTGLQKFRQVELPLAAPVMMGGVRTAAVWTIGAATLATPVGATSLGDFIFSGLQTEDWVAVAVGCGAAAALAIAVDGCLALAERGLALRSRWRLTAAAAGLAAIAALAMFGARGRTPEHAVVIGAKNFSEQYILAELIATRLRAAGIPVSIRSGLGSAVAFRALAAGDIDVYVDYAGTLATTVLHRTDNPPLPVLQRALTQSTGVGVVGPLGFENAYALTMRADRAAALHVRSIDDLARVSRQLTLGTDLEFQTRPEWRAVQSAYALRFGRSRAYEPTFMYRALASADADVISAFSSDGRITAQRLLVLTDPRRAVPSYDALLLVAPKRRRDVALQAALRPLVGSITIAAMRSANLMVDRDTRKATPAAAAATLAPR